MSEHKQYDHIEHKQYERMATFVVFICIFVLWMVLTGDIIGSIGVALIVTAIFWVIMKGGQK